ncbi:MULTISPECIES: ABC transporter permease [Bradyrhizobium]|jgi:NitT/TauT family transport system permease protein|uniref:ABC transporter permease subunit n=1 Tax=Bradyrhizobium denitrificans TaxID=2734912 RepID=A0ABS5GHW5_9BRAD|nr:MULTISPECIES: ABC transporter permease subunit [Bradyrhizobium]RTL99637.1 MAG: ABC transporter permease subunit [Bradyrhizobiaceae bacterium]MBR1140740.1 ABC transporter permease subunit [Bradyrhizobium denitrificans]MCL8488014.1 ABC transporter permease subunit [Bradyrhizobium denitrificans]MDH6264153.1 NitT/TauT family transport system permease protein [Bradyrhizobium sp. BR13661]MDU0953994.1 ABC transporter permease subunit [Bradyrhizobium sp.]
MRLQDLRLAVLTRAPRPNVWDLIALILVIGAMVLIVYGGKQTTLPLSALDVSPVSLDPANLPFYALRTTLRMLLAIACSTVFTFIYAAVAAKSRRAEMVLIPLLDILQSVPILGFLTFTVVFFLNLFPGRVLGAELACVFAIFTSQAWNMTFSMYQSLRNVPKDLDEASKSFHLSGWQRFWRLDVPFAMPGLIWNAMMSMSGGWFFVVASEAITVGNTTVTLPGVGSYVALAIEKRDLAAIGYAIFTMLLVIIVYDQLLFRPIVAWADKFRFEQTASGDAPTSWMLDLFRRTRALRALTLPFAALNRAFSNLSAEWPRALRPSSKPGAPPSRLIDALWFAIIGIATGYAAYKAYYYLSANLQLSDVYEAVLGGFATLLRVITLIALATLIWVPIGVWIGLRPRIAERVQPLAQFLAAFPANLAFPVFVLWIVHYGLNSNIWLSPLMILGTQWYILFNVIAGASAFPSDLREAAASLHLTGWRWWIKVILPGIFPYYVTGAITASGGSWNASIVAEVASWGDTHLSATGLGAYIAKATEDGDFPRVVLGIAIMCIMVTLFNRLFWRPLYAFGERRLRLG